MWQSYRQTENTTFHCQSIFNISTWVKHDFQALIKGLKYSYCNDKHYSASRTEWKFPVDMSASRGKFTANNTSRCNDIALFSFQGFGGHPFADRK